MTECPAEGCKKNLPSDTALANHASQSMDEKHQKYSTFAEALSAINRSQKMDETPDETPDDEPPEETTESPDGGSPEGEVTPEPSPDSVPSDPPDPGEPECPECGETDYFDPSEVARDMGVTYTGDMDRGCPNCSTKNEWFLYDKTEDLE